MLSENFLVGITGEVNKNRLIALEKLGGLNAKMDISQLPFCLRVVLESNLRHCKSEQELRSTIDLFANWQEASKQSSSINIYATRVLMQDYTGIPVLVDLCALRQAAINKGVDPETVNPKIPVDLVVDHSIVVNSSGNSLAATENSRQQYEQNIERFSFLKWVSHAFKNLRIIPPDSGICHQVNLESLATAYVLEQGDEVINLFPELVIGADSHTTTINSLGVLGWGVGGIEALGASLGESLNIPMPEVIGVRLSGQLGAGVTATDCVLTVTSLLRSVGVVNKFVEFFGPGAASLPIPDRATIANMAPEYGATCAFFPWDERTLEYLLGTGRDQEGLFKQYAQAASLWCDGNVEPKYSQVIEFNLSEVEPRISGPKKPEEKRSLSEVPSSFPNHDVLNSDPNKSGIPNGAVLLAAITSCTNTSNPHLMIAAGLLAKKAVLLGLTVPPWVKTLFAPGSLVVGEYLERSGLQNFLDQLGFQLCGFGCTACIGNSGPLLPAAQDAIESDGLVGCAVLSGNRNFSGRVQQQLQFNYLASPPLVIAYALAGKITTDLKNEPITKIGGSEIFLADVWPSNQEINEVLSKCLKPELFNSRRVALKNGSDLWEALKISNSKIYDWGDISGFVKQPPFFAKGSASSSPKMLIEKARILLLLGDGVTTDDISPAGRIQPSSVAGQYLQKLGVSLERLHTFGARRGHWDVMLRGAFTNPNLLNELAPEKKGGFTKVFPGGEITEILKASVDYQQCGTPLIIIAGKNYGTGSSRDDAARSTRLLGVAAVIAESYERIHRSNLAAFGVMPLLFKQGESRKSLNLDGSETITISMGDTPPLTGELVKASIERVNGEIFECHFISALRLEELAYFQSGGILPFLAYKLTASNSF
ncbi:aconitate hydratase AcnA [Polynucleobacter sp. VK25]|uniref:aconitate hydratase AcnA n=1 Tax=Polynucleobacter sp. VK25 TaxID=1758398 RepID=UPI001BFD04A9|nr:aconitate hydratase AcnA [Polynucleobacter sp. VK25]